MFDDPYQVVRENEEIKLELEEIHSKLERLTKELERERIYVEEFDRNYEMQLLKNQELQAKLEGQSTRYRRDHGVFIFGETFQGLNYYKKRI